MAFILWGIALALILAGIWMLQRSRKLRQASGLPQGQIVYADTDQWREPREPILSRRWGLVGRPDYLVAHGRDLIPVEVKSGRRPSPLYRSHLLQLGAYCLLVEDWTGHRPPHGLLHYENATVQVPFDDTLRQAVIDTLADMRRAARQPDVPRSHNDPARCHRCGVRHACDQSL
ncbi:MAG: CRISPR-associated protein Cas4 [Anaerolineae bacterium]|nr:CRISPR-associated protein Cas4 [Anaerolineae bacterium]